MRYLRALLRYNPVRMLRHLVVYIRNQARSLEERYWLLFLWPANFLCAMWYRIAMKGNGVLHVSYMVHVPYQTVELLRGGGVTADYLAIGTSPYWDKCDHLYDINKTQYSTLTEFIWLWSLLVKYQTVHLHFMTTPSMSSWELAWLKFAGRKIVAHFRGCEVRNRETNMRMFPEFNICQLCDYYPHPCKTEVNRHRHKLALHLADKILVTTRDMLTFVPTAQYFPFFAPAEEALPKQKSPQWPERRVLRIAHATNHQGIEGTQRIRETVNELNQEGEQIALIEIIGQTQEDALEIMSGCDIAIGKMKMGDYANAQIESMCMGLPTITYVRPEFMTDELRSSGFIFCTLDDLKSTLRNILSNPEVLNDKRKKAIASVRAIHDNTKLVEQMKRIYLSLNAERS